MRSLVDDLLDVREEYISEEIFASGSSVSVDVFLPKEKLAFEYQGEQHYHTIERFATNETNQQRDQQKRDLFKKVGITLIDIPYWWDRSETTLQNTIRHFRPFK
eukprot:TRINITY_DN7328_c0_g2_i3.p1 TRINITY_DN7328_c0_g2~~TRINITY_DN7328_c0_g2_i3.p1  ORF type:complete len:104 (+),score=24.08 TRINITY_DN7328_c0_g2_i3:233-544(+)